MEINITHRELTNYESWQQEKYGNILTEYIPLGDGKFAIDEEEQRRLEEWTTMQEEIKRWQESEWWGHNEGLLVGY